ncbi:MAG: Plug domain-containing protein, partial [Caulobacterales bacterium]|nr:Plug domain-containing protein [Caulobacterales bacterium]
MSRLTMLMGGISGLALMGAPAGFAQETPDDEETEVIIVTGTSAARSEFDTPSSVNQYSESELRTFTAASQADVLTQLPGVSAEGGGGEVATNFFVRGLPSGGQFQFTPLQYDGIPAFSTFGLNSSAFDVYYRNDLGIERLEYVTGGVSNLFGPGSVAG